MIPYCNHGAEIEHAAIGLRYEPSANKLQQIAEGVIKNVNHGDDVVPHFFAIKGSVQPGDRIVYHHPLKIEGDIARGSLDNSAGATACLLAALALCQVAPAVPVAFVFTDEEEGPPASNSTFGRGARRLSGMFDSPDLCVVVDGHDVSQQCSIGDGAVFAEKASPSKGGGIVPPHVYATFRLLAHDMVARGVDVTENLGHVSRSDDVACIEVTPNILLLGYPVSDPHFNQAVPAVSLSDILNLSKAIYRTAIADLGV